MNQPLHAQRHGAVLEMTFNRPDCRNALSAELIAALMSALHDAASDGTRAVVLTGTPPAFCAGLDLREVAASFAQVADHDTTPLLQLYDAVRHCPCPVVAAVNGAALAGGAALVALCDVVIAADSAQLGFPGVRHGLVAPIVMTVLQHELGTRRARHLILTGRALSAAEAERYGLVDEVVPPDHTLSRARSIASDLAAQPIEGLTGTKAVLRELVRESDEARELAGRVRYAPAAASALSRFLASEGRASNSREHYNEQV